MSSFKCSCESSNQHLQFGWCVVSLQEHANSRVCLGTTYSLDADEQGHAVVTDGRYCLRDNAGVYEANKHVGAISSTILNAQAPCAGATPQRCHLA